MRKLLLQRVSPALAELIGYPNLGDTFRVTLSDLFGPGWDGGRSPTLRDLADVLGEPEERLREIRDDVREPAFELGLVLIPLVASFDPQLAAELRDSLETLTDTGAIAEWLDERVSGLPIGAHDLIAACQSGDLNAARTRLGISLRELNAVIDALGPPFERLQNPDGIKQEFDYFVMRHKSQIQDALRAAFLPFFLENKQLDEYVGCRDLQGLDLDPAWLDDYFHLDDPIIAGHVDEWLNSHGAQPLGTRRELGPARGAPADEQGARQRRGLSSLRSHSGVGKEERPALVRRPGELGVGGGQGKRGGDTGLRALTDRESSRGSSVTERGRPECPEPSTLRRSGSRSPRSRRPRVRPTTQLAAAVMPTGRSSSTARRSAPRRRTSRPSSKRFAQVCRRAFSLRRPGCQRSRFNLLEKPKRRGRGGRGTTAARQPRLSPAQMDAVGLAGEVAAYGWLEANYEEFTDASWCSGYRNRIDGTGGDDSHGYDFEILTPRRRLMFEVKATTGAGFEVDLTDLEMRAARGVRRNEQYHILFVAHALTSEERAIYLLPNPLGQQGIGRYRTVGSGLRLKFELDRPE